MQPRLIVHDKSPLEKDDFYHFVKFLESYHSRIIEYLESLGKI